MTLDEDLELAEAVDADLVAAFGPRHPVPLLQRDTFEVDPPADAARSTREGMQQRAAYLYPIVAPDDHAFRCVNCGQDFERGLGCVECLEPTCTACVRTERHICVPPTGGILPTGEFSLGEVAAAEGVSRERVRQIEMNALSRLRHTPVMREIGREAPVRCYGCALALDHAGDCLPRLLPPAHERGLARQADAAVALRSRTKAAKRKRHLAELAQEEHDHIAAIAYKLRHEARRFDVSQLRGLIHEANARLRGIQSELERELKKLAAIETALDHERG